MKPYYEQDGITIYHADCADVLPLVDPGEVGLVLTDPPYGIGVDIKYAQLDGSSMVYQPVVGDDEPFDPTDLLKYPRVVLFGANHFAHRLPSSKGWLIWDKRAGKQESNMFADAEVAWCSFPTKTRIFRHLWGVNRDSEQHNFRLHPTQKPVALMRWILEEWTRPGDLIFDPYMGSGPVAQACHEMGRRYIGVEIVEDYCKIAVQRLAQGVLALGGLDTT